MKITTSKCEEDFIRQIIRKGRRLDGRGEHAGRAIEIAFGNDGCCIVGFDNTRVSAQVSCELTAPRPSRPAEGALHVNLELSPMADPNFKSGRMSEAGVEASRLLERSIRDSRCIDVESLCIVAGLKVWTIRVDVHALNNDGNLIECASVAVIAALAHFKRPHVSVIGTDVTVHSVDDHKPVSLTLHHMPVVVSLAVFDEGEVIIVDPVELEERVASGKIMFGVNAHQEICSSHLSGAMMLKKDTVLQCSTIAVKRAQLLTQKIRTALDNDSYLKATNQPTGFVTLLRTSTILGARHPINQIAMTSEKVEDEDIEEVNQDDDVSVDPQEQNYTVEPSQVKEEVKIFLQGPETSLFEGGSSRWQLDDDDDDESEDSVNEDDVVQNEETEGPVVTVNDSDESSEDEQVFLKSDQVDIRDKTSVESRGWYTKDAFF